MCLCMMLSLIDFLSPFQAVSGTGMDISTNSKRIVHSIIMLSISSVLPFRLTCFCIGLHIVSINSNLSVIYTCSVHTVIIIMYYAHDITNSLMLVITVL